MSEIPNASVFQKCLWLFCATILSKLISFQTSVQFLNPHSVSCWGELKNKFLKSLTLISEQSYVL